MEIQDGYYVFVYDNDENKNAKGTAYIGEFESKYYFQLFVERFKKKYTGMYIVKFFHIGTDGFCTKKIPPWKSDLWITDSHNRKTTQLSKDKEYSLKLLLRDSLSISAGKIRPLKLAIEVANEIREICGSKFNNVPNVFQEHQDAVNANCISALSELTRPHSVAVPPVIHTAPADYSPQIQAATGVGMPTALEAYEASIGEPNGTPVNVRDRGVYGDMLRALVDSNHPDEKYRHWTQWKNGIGYTDIAKSENPDWETQYGREEAQRLWRSEASKIQKQVERFENEFKKQK